MPEFGPSFIHAAVLILRKLLPLLAMVGVSLAFAAPSTAAQLHGFEHSVTKVTAGQHHHHAADGSVEAHQDSPDSDTDDDRDARGVGHSHASSAAGEVIENAAATTTAVATRGAQLADSTDQKLPAIEPPPRERPPRTA